MKYLFGFLILAGLVSCSKEMITEDSSTDKIEIGTRSSSSAIPLVDDLNDYTQFVEAKGYIFSSISSYIQNRLALAKSKLNYNAPNSAISVLNKLIDFIMAKVASGSIPSSVGSKLKNMILDIIEEINAVDNDGDGYSVGNDCDDNNAILNPDNTSGLQVFGAITMETIMSQDLDTEPINGDANATNLLTPGAIVLYKTNQGRFGKLVILDYDTYLKIKFVTYDNDGSQFYSDSGTIIHASWNLDLDNGQLGMPNGNDIWWNHLTNVERELTPLDNVAITLFECM